jgi:hypothetical protein
MQIARETLQILGFTEFDGKKGDFVIIDSEVAIGRSCTKLIKILKKYKNMPFIILNRCEKILGSYNRLWLSNTLPPMQNTIMMTYKNGANKI